jgi:hypothetical protein
MNYHNKKLKYTIFLTITKINKQIKIEIQKIKNTNITIAHIINTQEYAIKFTSINNNITYLRLIYEPLFNNNDDIIEIFQNKHKKEYLVTNEKYTLIFIKTLINTFTNIHEKNNFITLYKNIIKKLYQKSYHTNNYTSFTFFTDE